MSIRAMHLAYQLVAEWLPRKVLEQRQLALLQRVVRFAYNETTSYRCLMQRAGIRPEQIQRLADIERLPIVTKQDLLEFSEDERTSNRRASTKGGRRIVTSGTSGTPFEFDIDRPCDLWRKAQYLRPYVTNGRRPWHKVLRLTASSPSVAKSGSRWSPFSEHLMSSSGGLSAQIAVIQAQRPAEIQGYPSALRCLAYELIARRIKTPSIRRVFTDSELLTPEARTLIETAFESSVIDIYGSYETDNIAYQCSPTSDYHIAIDSVIAETRSHSEHSDYDGEDLVVTVLRNQMTPFIRYNLGDQVRMLDGHCECGRSFPLMRIVAGRNDDLVTRADGKCESPMAMLYRLDFFSEFVREYQVAQTSVGTFVVRLVPTRPLNSGDEQRINDAVCIDFPEVSVAIETHTKLQRTAAGKLKSFVNELRTATSYEG